MRYHGAVVIDFEVQKIVCEGIKVEDFPYSVHHDISPFSEEWSKLYNWCIEKAGQRNEAWDWNVSSKILFKKEEDAIEFALAWGGK